MGEDGDPTPAPNDVRKVRAHLHLRFRVRPKSKAGGGCARLRASELFQVSDSKVDIKTHQLARSLLCPPRNRAIPRSFSDFLATFL